MLPLRRGAGAGEGESVSTEIPLNGYMPLGAFSLKSKMFSSDTIWAASSLPQRVNPHRVTDEGEQPGKEKLSKGHLKKSSAELSLNYFSPSSPVFWIIPKSGMQKKTVVSVRTTSKYSDSGLNC